MKKTEEFTIEEILLIMETAAPIITLIMKLVEEIQRTCLPFIELMSKIEADKNENNL